ERPARVNSLLTPDRWLEPVIVAEVLADEITPSPRHTAGMTADRAGLALRFPRIVSFRSADKRPEDATTVREVLEMFEEQRARVNSLLTPDRWLEPVIVAEVLADEITPSPRHTAGMTADRAGLALRFPRIVSFRSADKRPEDATTVREVLEMFEQQRARA